MRERMNARVEIPDGCERLLDLIKCDDARLKPAFFWSVQNTLVCASLERARQVAFEGAGGVMRRTVTLQVRQCSHSAAALLLSLLLR